MKLLRRMEAQIRVFFRVDLPMFWHNRSLFGKISLGCFGTILAQLLLVGLVFGFAFLMTKLNSNQTYEILYPAEQINSIEILHVDTSLSLYKYPMEEFPEIVRQHTVSSIFLDKAAIPACMDELHGLSAGRWWNDPSPYIEGGTLLITYANGSFELICANGTFYYDAGSSDYDYTWYFFDHDEFLIFLERYGYQSPK